MSKNIKKYMLLSYNQCCEFIWNIKFVLYYILFT